MPSRPSPGSSMTRFRAGDKIKSGPQVATCMHFLFSVKLRSSHVIFFFSAVNRCSKKMSCRVIFFFAVSRVQKNCDVVSIFFCGKRVYKKIVQSCNACFV